MRQLWSLYTVIAIVLSACAGPRNDEVSSQLDVPIATAEMTHSQPCGPADITAASEPSGCLPQDAELTGAIPTTAGVSSGVPTPLDEIKDDVALGKEHYQATNYGLAELHFRRAAQTSRKNAEAWLGLAASYDRLKRFDLADRAYREVLRLTGPTPELLNNRGFSYLLRGALGQAKQDLETARAKDPENERILNNLAALKAAKGTTRRPN